MKANCYYLVSIIFFCFTSTTFSMCDCHELLGEWSIPYHIIKDWDYDESPTVVIYSVEHVPGTDGIYNLNGCINGHVLVDSKCIEQYGRVQTISLITKEFFFRSNAPNLVWFCGFFRDCFVQPCPPTFFGLR